MARPKKDPNAEQTEVKLLRIAEESFGRLGYAATRLEDVAAEAGIKRSSLLYYFQSKRALYSRVLKLAFQDVFATLANALTEDLNTYEERLDAVVGGLVHYSAERPGALAVALRELVTPNGEEKSFVTDNLQLLVGQIEAFVRAEVGDRIEDGYPLGDAIQMLVITHLVRAAAGDTASQLWGDSDSTMQLSRILLGAKPKA